MTSTAIRHTLSALAAVALVSAFSTGPVSAEPYTQFVQMSTQLMNELQNTERELVDSLQTMHRNVQIQAQKPKAPKGLATRRGPQASAGIDAIDMGDGTWILSTPKARR